MRTRHYAIRALRELVLQILQSSEGSSPTPHPAASGTASRCEWTH